MAKETPNQAHEEAFAVLKSAVKEGTLSEGLQARLTVLAQECVRPQTTQILTKCNEAPAIIKAPSQEFRRLVDSLRLEEGYERALKAVKALKLIPYVPDRLGFSRVLRVFTPEMLAIAQSFQEPRLIVMDRGYSSRQLESVYHNKLYWKRDRWIPEADAATESSASRQYRDEKAEFCGAYIVEGPVHPDLEIQNFDDNSLPVKARLKRFAKYKKFNGVGGMDRFKYVHLAALALIEGGNIDQNESDEPVFRTILDEDPVLSGAYRKVVTGCNTAMNGMWMNAKSSLREKYPNYCFRRSVGGVMPNL